MLSLLQDAKFALRQLRKAPVFTLSAVLTLGLGIGANATLFNWMNSILLNPLPAVNADGLFALRWRMPEGRNMSWSWPTYVDVKEKNAMFAGLATGRMTAFSVGDEAQPERVFGMLVSANYFDVLGVRPIEGRTFRPEEDQRPGAHPVVVISHAWWKSRYGGDPRMVGREIRLNRRAFTVVGIAPEGFQGSMPGLRHDLWVPVMMRAEIMGGADVLGNRGDRWLEGYGRLKPGVSIRQGEENLSVLSAQLTREYEKVERYARAEATPMWRNGAGQVLGPVLLLMAAVVGVLLLIACANVGNLLLARAAGRRREIAIRLALGIGRVRLMRQLLVENGLLSLAGGAIALGLIPFTSGLLTRFLPPTDVTVGLQIRPDWKVLVFTLVVSAVATILFGLAPAWGAARADVVRALKEEALATTSKGRLRGALVVAQVALSLTLLIGAGLLLRSLQRATAADPGFDPRQVLVLGVDLRPNGYDEKRGPEFVRQALTRIAQVPGVESVSTVRRVPLGLGGSSSSTVSVEGYAPAKDEEMNLLLNYVGPDYFRTMGTKVTAGRDFRREDDGRAAPAMVVNETFARRYLAGSDGIGRRVRTLGRDFTVVGVVRDSKFGSLDEEPAPFVWMSNLQMNQSETNFVVRTATAPLGMVRAVEEEIRTLDRAIPVYGVRTLEDSISGAYLGQRIGSWMLGLFGGLALLLAAVGLYGVLAHAVALRTREFGIRLALGATRWDMLRLVLAHGLQLTGLGLAIGLGLSVGVTRFLQKLLFGVSPTDAVTLVGVALVLSGVALVACYLPARRAMRIDPIVAMRYE